MHRLFVAMRLPEAVRDLLIDMMDDGLGLRWTAEAQLHLTLRFIGEVERPLGEDIAAALARVRSEPFDLRLGGVGRFDQRGSGALWAGVEPRAPVATLAAKVDRACVAAGLAPERRAFHPHVTLARFKRGDEAKVRAFVDRHADLAWPRWTTSDFTLFESHLSRHGPHYEAVAGFGLGATDYNSWSTHRPT